MFNVIKQPSENTSLSEMCHTLCGTSRSGLYCCLLTVVPYVSLKALATSTDYDVAKIDEGPGAVV